MKILVTGGAGFIGSHIVDMLVQRKDEVVIVDNLSTGNIKNINKKAKFYKNDIQNRDILQIFNEFQPQVVIHTAAQIDVQQSLKQPVLDASVNINGTINLLEACKESGVSKIIYSSSAAVYGNPKYLGIDEKHPKNPLSFYGISKYTPEHYIKAYHHLHGIKYSILRYANVYGIRQDPKGEGGVISIFLSKMLNGEAPVIFGDGEQTRDFIYVEDVARANVMAIDQCHDETVNIGTNTPTTVNQLYSMMELHIRSGLKPLYGPERKGDIVHSYLDNAKAAACMGWKPVYSLQEGLEKTIEYYSSKDRCQ